MYFSILRKKKKISQTYYFKHYTNGLSLEYHLGIYQVGKAWNLHEN